MGLSAWFGLCEHKWKPTGERVEHSVGLAQGFSEKIITGHTAVAQCERCGAIRGFRIS